MLILTASFYEGHSIQDIAFPIRVLKLLGVRQLIGSNSILLLGSRFIDIAILVTNAAGALNPEYAVGDIVILSDVSIPINCNEVSLLSVMPIAPEPGRTRRDSSTSWAKY